jgi:hypothetical protein
MKALSMTPLLALTPTLSYAQVSNLNVASTQEKIYRIGGCNVRVHELLGGRFEAYTDDSPPAAGYTGPLKRDKEKSNTAFMIRCAKPSEVELRDCGLDLVDGKLHTTEDDDSTPEEMKLLDSKRIELKGKNWQGAGVQENPVLSPDGRRGITFRFCLPYKGLILSGYTSTAGYPYRSNESAIPNIIKLLESIEFVDDAVIESATKSEGDIKN